MEEIAKDRRDIKGIELSPNILEEYHWFIEVLSFVNENYLV